MRELRWYMVNFWPIFVHIPPQVSLRGTSPKALGLATCRLCYFQAHFICLLCTPPALFQDWIMRWAGPTSGMENVARAWNIFPV